MLLFLIFDEENVEKEEMIEVIDVEKITLATKIINPILDKTNLLNDVEVLDIHSKEKGDINNE